MGSTTRTRVFRFMRRAKVQISLRIHAVWSRPSMSANRIIGYYRMYEWTAKVRMIHCACEGWSESARFAHVWKHFFAWRCPCWLQMHWRPRCSYIHVRYILFHGIRAAGFVSTIRNPCAMQKCEMHWDLATRIYHHIARNIGNWQTPSVQKCVTCCDMHNVRCTWTTLLAHMLQPHFTRCEHSFSSRDANTQLAFYVNLYRAVIGPSG